MLFSSIGLQEPVKSLEMDGFVITERFHPPHGAIQRHDHEVTIIGVILKGSFIESASGRSFECTPYSLQILPAWEQHSYKFGREGVHCLTVEVKPQRLEGIRLFSQVLDRVTHLSAERLLTLLRQLYREFRAGESVSVLTVEGLVLETLGAATQNLRISSSLQPKWLSEVREFIHGHFTERVSLAGLATFAEVHPAHLARMFRKHYGCSVGDYIRRLRLDYALRQLATDTPLAEIAAAAGFYDQSHFTHAFKLGMKMTPGEYRFIARAKRR